MGIYDIQAQKISENDYSKIKVDDLTDDQIKAIVQKADLSGMTESEIEIAASDNNFPREL